MWIEFAKKSDVSHEVLARRYWSGVFSDDSEPEILFDGVIRLLNFDWENRCHLLK